ncbi:NAD(P)H-dependent oxidoreductase [Mesonia ostreae]|uniref:NAD(P)H-dependent oxidoreductase n=1 Tax=Mesonia ostreae TaxID=861110 RepID=A0ABU2KJR4_9FLAO|nr:NAD(P)H-dependent oxidoreductase [Mesonia ostreae]MDT0294965.1 NAD(P)H-dependent oxidoreductase [Mesonia ostreae]
MDIINSLEWRYAAKKFDTEKKIPIDKIEVLKKAFSLTPSSYGLQPIKLVIIDEEEVLEQLMESCYNQKQIKTASHLFVFCIDDAIDEEFILNYFKRVKDIRNTPDEILKPFKNFLLKDFEKSSKNKIDAWAKNQVYLAMGNLLTVCALEKIDSCPMEGFHPGKLAEVLDLDQLHLKPTLLLPIGYRAEDDMFSQFKKVRKPLDDTTLHYKK